LRLRGTGAAPNATRIVHPSDEWRRAAIALALEGELIEAEEALGKMRRN